MRLDIVKSDDNAREKVRAMLRAFNAPFAENFADYSFHISENGEIIAGIVAIGVCDALEIEFLFVNAAHRGKRLGSRLIRHVERLAAADGRKRALLNTYSYQAVGFYEKLGYTRLFAIDPCFGKHSQHYFIKELGVDDMRNITFETFTESDIPELTAIMTRSFDADSMLHLGVPGGPPGYNDGSFLRKWGIEEGADHYKILLDGATIGAVILFIRAAEHMAFLGTIFIDSELQEKGIGAEIWQLVEQKYPEIFEWHTETPMFSRRNHNFYVNKLGFHVVRIDNPKDMHAGSFVMIKKVKGWN